MSKPLALASRKISFLASVSEFLHLPFDVLDALNNSSQLISRNVNWSAHGLLLVNMTRQKSDILTAASRCAGELGKQTINDFRLARNAIRLSPIEIISAHCLGQEFATKNERSSIANIML
jgi:hypothetical protein